MTKELLTIEFRYNDIPKSDTDSKHRSKSKTITIGVFDTFEEAIAEGNKAMEVFEKHFELNPHYNKKERFSTNGGCFGYPKRLITALGYLQIPFEFYAKIEQLKYDDVEQTIVEVLEAGKRYEDYELLND
jgi:hypothetical protein